MNFEIQKNVSQSLIRNGTDVYISNIEVQLDKDKSCS